jgi:hypothetical protein
MKKYFLLFFINITLFANDMSLFYLEKEKKALISSYFHRIEDALHKKLLNRALLLEETLTCFTNSKTKKDITNCKIDERKRIMALIN